MEIFDDMEIQCSGQFLKWWDCEEQQIVEKSSDFSYQRKRERYNFTNLIRQYIIC